MGKKDKPKTKDKSTSAIKQITVPPIQIPGLGPGLGGAIAPQGPHPVDQFLFPWAFPQSTTQLHGSGFEQPVIEKPKVSQIPGWEDPNKPKEEEEPRLPANVPDDEEEPKPLPPFVIPETYPFPEPELPPYELPIQVPPIPDISEDDQDIPEEEPEPYVWPKERPDPIIPYYEPSCEAMELITGQPCLSRGFRTKIIPSKKNGFSAKTGNSFRKKRRSQYRAPGRKKSPFGRFRYSRYDFSRL